MEYDTAAVQLEKWRESPNSPPLWRLRELLELDAADNLDSFLRGQITNSSIAAMNATLNRLLAEWIDDCHLPKECAGQVYVAHPGTDPTRLVIVWPESMTRYLEAG